MWVIRMYILQTKLKEVAFSPANVWGMHAQACSSAAALESLGTYVCMYIVHVVDPCRHPWTYL